MDTNIKHSRLTEVVLRFDLTTHNEHYQVEVTQDEDLGYVDVVVYDDFRNKVVDEQIVDNLSNYIFTNFNI